MIHMGTPGTYNIRTVGVACMLQLAHGYMVQMVRVVELVHPVQLVHIPQLVHCHNG